MITNKYNGFTFIELMIVVVLMTIMGGVAFVSLQSSKANARLQSAQREVTATIKQAQSYALQGKMQGTAKVCGYGVKFTSVNEYKIFYKTPNSGMTCDDKDYAEYGVAENLQLENGVVLSSPSEYEDTEIYFAIPFGNAFDSAGTALNSDIELFFQYPAETGETKSISINPRGSVFEN